MRAYSNNGHSFRTFGDADVLEEGEVLLSDDPTEDEIAAAFPNYYDPIPTQPPAPPQAVAYDHENRLRALEGLPPLTMEDFLGQTGL